MKLTHKDTEVFHLGDSKYDSPLNVPHFIDDDSRVIARVEFNQNDLEGQIRDYPSFENAGPRKKLFFNPEETSAAVVTCGGLCPGLNNVIQSIVLQLYRQYGVKRILGVRYGYEGLNPEFNHPFVELNPAAVEGIDRTGGTVLGTSRGMQDVSVLVDTLVRENIQILFTVGGDGTLRGANALFEEIKKRKLEIAVVGVPKTIDNDISLIDRTFGFETAVAEATRVIYSAHAEAKSARNGIGLVKLMGRDSGFIAAYTALASNDVNFVLIPESPFLLEGENGFLVNLKRRLEKKGHAVVVVAEGAGQEYFNNRNEKDSSGNRKHGDIGIFLRDQIIEYFKNQNFHINLKYIDPSYIIRSTPPSSDDAVSCIMLAQNAVHGAMSGRSNIVIGRWNSYYTFLPIPLAVRERKKIDPSGYLWSIVKEATGQSEFV